MQFEARNNKDAKLCIIGSGFLHGLCNNISKCNYFFKIDVIGNSNKELWGDKPQQHLIKIMT